MRFFVRKRRQTPTVIIVALIDILIVLLIFLMVTTTFKQQPALRLALPESSQAQKSGANETPPLVVSVDAEGSLRLGNQRLHEGSGEAVGMPSVKHHRIPLSSFCRRT